MILGDGLNTTKKVAKLSGQVIKGLTIIGTAAIISGVAVSKSRKELEKIDLAESIKKVNTPKKAVKLSGKILKGVAVAGTAGMISGIAILKSRQALKDIGDVSMQIYNLVRNSI